MLIRWTAKTVDEAMDLEQTFHKLMESRRCRSGRREPGRKARRRRGIPRRVSEIPYGIKCALGLGRAEGLHRQSPRCKERGNMSNDNLVPEPQPSVFDAVNGVLQARRPLAA